MKVLLLQPNYDVHVLCPPIALGYLASCLEKDGHQVSIYDGTLRNASEDDFLAGVDRFTPDLVGITVMSRGHNRVKRIISSIKQRFDIPIVVGGPQVTAFPELVLRDLNANFAIVGEGEITICELAKYITSKNGDYDQINGLAYLAKDGSIKVNKRRSLISDLDQIPFPAWHLMPPSKYRIVPILSPAKGFPIAPIVTTRGCPFHCTFCASNVTWHYKFRMRSPENVVSEIKLLVEKFGVREIHISDDNFTLKKKYAEEICSGIIKQNLDISWQCSNGVRVDRLDINLLEKMKKAGCYSVGLGIESGNQDVLNGVKKMLDLSVAKKVLLYLKKVGIRSYGFFILGLPGETHRTIRETIDFAKNNPFDRAWFNILTPYPGSEIFDDWIKDRSIKDIDWDSHDGSTAVRGIVDISTEELEHYQRRAAREFYLRPRILLDLMTHMSFKQVITIMMTRFFKKRFDIVYWMVHSLVRRRSGAEARQENRRLSQ